MTGPGSDVTRYQHKSYDGVVGRGKEKKSLFSPNPSVKTVKCKNGLFAAIMP